VLQRPNNSVTSPRLATTQRCSLQKSTESPGCGGELWRAGRNCSLDPVDNARLVSFPGIVTSVRTPSSPLLWRVANGDIGRAASILARRSGTNRADVLVWITGA